MSTALAAFTVLASVVAVPEAMISTPLLLLPVPAPVPEMVMLPPAAVMLALLAYTPVLPSTKVPAALAIPVMLMLAAALVLALPTS